MYILKVSEFLFANFYALTAFNIRITFHIKKYNFYGSLYI